MTNLEKIRSMTTEELAVFLCAGDKACEGCKYENDPEKCWTETEPFRRWLESEASTEGEKRT